MSKKRNFLTHHYYHIYNRTIDKQKIFFTYRDYAFFYERLLFYKKKYNIRIFAYCLLPNHFHLLIKEGKNTKIASQFISVLCSSYAMRFNARHQRNGHVWQGRFKSREIFSDKYLAKAINYIDLNPIKHKIVTDIEDWPYTSYHERQPRAGN